jgi:hypothetical protein
MNISCSDSISGHEKFFKFVKPLISCLINKEGRIFLYPVAKLLRETEKKSFL